MDLANLTIEDIEKSESIRNIYALALPSDQMMFNIMRSCIGLTQIEDLWFYHKRLLYND